MKILLTGAFKYNDEQIQKIKMLGYDVIFAQKENEPLQIDVSDIDALICNNLFLHNDIRSFSSLKLIQLTSAGLDRVPLEYINENNIQLFNAREVYSIPMAEWAVLKTLEILKRSSWFYQMQKRKEWTKNRDIIELYGKTVSIIGTGSVGLETAKRFKAFGVQIIGVDLQSINSEYIDEQYHVSKIDIALSKSDVVVLTLPLTEQTYHIINSEKLNSIKQGSILINISRGSIIDETALIESLSKSKLLGAALDVFENEPLPPDSLLWNYDNVIITPHNSFVSEKINDRLFELAYKNLSEFIGRKD
jgi:phosphoglycerate dehydrogenase-like enzyme